MLDWAGAPSLHSVGGLFWAVPLLSFSLILGLGVDYNIFLIMRIIEYRKMPGVTVIKIIK